MPETETIDALPRLRLLAEWHKPAGKTPLQKKPNTYQTISAAVAEIERLRAVLKEISELHIPSVPMAMAGSYTDAEWAARHVATLRRLAKEAIVDGR